MLKSAVKVSFKRRLPSEQIELETQEDYQVVEGKQVVVEGALGDLSNIYLPIKLKSGEETQVKYSDLSFGRSGIVSFKRTLADKTKVDDEGNETIIKGKTITVRARLGVLDFLWLPVIEEDGTEVKVQLKDLTFKEVK